MAKNEEQIPMSKLMDCLVQEGFDEKSADLVLKQVEDWEREGNMFDYRNFVCSTE